MPTLTSCSIFEDSNIAHGYFATNTPWSMLHLDGDNNTTYSGNGWRKWMKTGVFMRTFKNSL
jgi:hypothetical protein